MADVFLSYARADRAQAERIKGRLEALGLEVFFDLHGGIEAGDHFPERIGKAIRDAKAMLACWSPVALGRDWCRREAYIAQQLGKLVPVALAKVTTRDLLELSTISYESLQDYQDQPQHHGWSRTLAAIARLLNDWLLDNPDDADAARVRRLALAVREASKAATPDARAGSDRATARDDAAIAWETVDKTSIRDLLLFADSFPGKALAFAARRYAETLREAEAALAKADHDDLGSLTDFLRTWPEYPKVADVERRIEELEEAARQTAAAARRQAEAERQAEERRVKLKALVEARAVQKAAERDAAREQHFTKFEWFYRPVFFLFRRLSWVLENLGAITAVYVLGLAVLDWSYGSEGGQAAHLFRYLRTEFFNLGSATGLWAIVMAWVVAPVAILAIGPTFGWSIYYLLNIAMLATLVAIWKGNEYVVIGFWARLGTSLVQTVVAISVTVHFLGWLIDVVS